VEFVVNQSSATSEASSVSVDLMAVCQMLLMTINVLNSLMNQGAANLVERGAFFS